MAWGRIAQLPDDISKALRSEVEGESGAAEKFLNYCDQETKGFR